MSRAGRQILDQEQANAVAQFRQRTSTQQPPLTAAQLISEERHRPGVEKDIVNLRDARKKYSYMWESYEDRFWQDRVHYVVHARIQS